MSSRRPAVLLAVLGLALVLAGCGGLASSTSQAPDGGPALAEVEPLTDPLSHVGESTAVLGDTSISPVADGPQPELPVTVTDAQGSEVTVHDVSRILALDLYGTTARTVFELGLGKHVVGRDASSGFAEAADLPLVTANGHDLNGEAILELSPTVIITDTSLGPWDVMLQMRDAGIPVVVVDSHRSLDTAGDLIRQVAAALGVPAEGEKLAERTTTAVEEMIEQIAAIAPTGDARLRMVFLYVRGQSGIYYMFGTGSGTDSLITALGGIDVATEIGWDGMRPLNDEGLVAADPDLILMMSGGLSSVEGVDGLLERVPALAITPAGQHRRVVDMADTEILSFGSNAAQVLEALAVAIYAPDAA
ncbi:heme/hemin ABC transporter substrate-binding protein [Pseudactinotalea suaedae]|uniref:heme/hemin ABC transporter substrate-binding protein n=1 Tax=Pseudactinotalea suaedae TaxID=1524924 RepID=UPI0012E2D3BE|nr:ABC transporter substrate-binding protein [Pseudactinotalea suaedae]